jgi:hypothetical protein
MMITRTAAVATAACLILAWGVVPARAQVHLQLLGGVTDTASRDALFGAGLGFRAGPVELDVEGGRMREILPTGIIDRLNQFQRDRGLPVQAVASLPATYGLASFRIIAPHSPVQPFIAVGAGLARLEPRLNVIVEGVSLGDIFGITRLDPVTAGMVTAAAGLRFDLGQVLVDAAYRYHGIYADFTPQLDFVRDKVLINVNSVYIGLGVKF